MTLKHSLFTAALTVSALFTFAAAGQLSTVPVNARRVRWSRRYHRHYRVRRPRIHRPRRSSNRGNKYGYWKHYWKHGRKHSYFYKYKSGYYHYGHWVSYHSHHRARRSRFVVKFRKVRSPRHHSNDTEGILTPDEIQSPSQNNDQTTDQSAQSEDDQPSQSHFHVKFRKISGPSDDDSENPSESKIARDMAEMKAQTLTDINNDRAAYGVSPLTESDSLDELANVRAQQLQSNYSHFDANGNQLMVTDAEQLGTTSPSAECIDETTYGHTFLNDYTPVNNRNGYDLANTEENELVNHDQVAGNGHRDAILNPNYTQIGIGTNYNPNSEDGFNVKLAEDFA